jgi:hypothetical protein
VNAIAARLDSPLVSTLRQKSSGSREDLLLLNILPKVELASDKKYASGSNAMLLRLLVKKKGRTSA